MTAVPSRSTRSTTTWSSSRPEAAAVELGIEGRSALVVAGSRGLGRATAMALAGEGARIMLSSRSESSLDEARAALAASGAEVEIRAADISDPAAPARLVAETIEAFGRLDIVIANAGGPPPGHALDLDDLQLDAALNTNLLSAVRLARGAGPSMREQDR